jgi:hypothetical protein
MAMRRLGLALTLVLGLLSLTGCQQTSDPVAAVGSGPGSDPSGDPVGSFTMSLTAAGKYQFNQVSYDLVGNGFHKADTINVSASTTLSAVVGGIPFGTGYHVQLTAQDADHKLTPCTGTASFDIQAATTVSVPVTLDCREAAVTQNVPVPPWASFVLGALLLALGMLLVRRFPRAARS